ncbi:MAG: IS110 family transposase [Planctomycetes bacterium]|nr:IS110 family transposase [Planctomycetota bacterium]
METRLSNKQKWLKTINLTADDELYIGIDVHKKSYHIAFWLNDAPAINFVAPADNQKTLQILQRFTPAIKLIVYEAGPTGYSLARLLLQNKLPIKIAAPSMTPRQAAVQSKTDSIDCRKLAKYAAKGMLKYVIIPTIKQEAHRQLARMRQILIEKQRRVKLQIKSFLLQHGIPQPQGLSCWSNIAVEKLARIIISKQLRYCLDLLLEQLHFIKAQVSKLESETKQHFAKNHIGKKVKLLQTHPGIGPTIARQFATEIFNPKRFKNSTQISKYLGLAPTVKQSGQTLRDGPISKTGRPVFRSNLIEASWTWIRKDPLALRTYKRILSNTGQKNKAITAMARKLTIHLWKMSCDNKPFVPGY